MISDKIKVKIAVLSQLQDLSNADIGECVRSVIEFTESGVVPPKSDRLYKYKSLLITAAKRSATALYGTMTRQQNEINLSNDPMIKAFKTEFEKIYYTLHHIQYAYSKYDTKNIVSFLKKIEEQMTKSGLPITQEEVLKNAVIFIRRVINLNDRWIITNLSVGLLTNMFTKLYVKIKDYDQAKRNNNISNEYIANAVAEFVGITKE
jgi:hypothetical protein